MADYSDPSYAKQMVRSTSEVEISAVWIFRIFNARFLNRVLFYSKCYFYHLYTGMYSSPDKIKSLFERTEILPLRMAFSVLSKSTLKLFVKEDIVQFQSYLYLWSWAGNISQGKIHFPCNPMQPSNPSSSWLPDLPTGPFHQSVLLTTLSWRSLIFAIRSTWFLDVQ